MDEQRTIFNREGVIDEQGFQRILENYTEALLNELDYDSDDSDDFVPSKYAEYRAQHRVILNTLLHKLCPPFFKGNTKEQANLLLSTFGEDADPIYATSAAKELHISANLLAFIIQISSAASLAAFKDIIIPLLKEPTETEKTKDKSRVDKDTEMEISDNKKDQSPTPISSITIDRNPIPTKDGFPISPEDPNAMIVDLSTDDAETTSRNTNKRDTRKQSPKTDTPKNASKNKKKKPLNRNSTKVITGHTPTEDNKKFVRTIIIYDIPSSWRPEKILSELALWGKTISISTRVQKKYQTVRLHIEMASFQVTKFDRGDWMVDLGGLPVRWFPANWTLQERKKREAFQACIKNIPDSMNVENLWTPGTPHALFRDLKIQSWKIIQLSNKERRLLAYFKDFDSQRDALDKSVIWGNDTWAWVRHDTPKLRKKKSVSYTDDKASSSSKTRKRNSNGKKKEKNSTPPKTTKHVAEKKGTSGNQQGKKGKMDKHKVLAEITRLLALVIE